MNKSLKNLLWLLLLIAISVGTVLIITSSSKGFSWGCFIHFLSKADPLWMAAAFLCAFGFVYFEGCGLQCTCRFFVHPCSAGSAVFYSATDIYFSAITPSAAGGQPAALLVMMRRGIPAAVAAIALLLNLVMYTVSILAISGICIAVNPQILLHMPPAPKLFIAFGTVVQIVFIIIFLLCIFNDAIVLTVCRWCLKLLCRLHIVKNYGEKYEKLLGITKQYKECGILIKSETRLLIKVFLCNLAQRLSVILVAVCVYMGVGGVFSRAFEVFSVQALAVLGSNAVPVPGAVGVADFILLSGFRHIVADPVSVELLSRGISFYSTFLFCGILILTVFIRGRIKQGEKHGKQENDSRA